MVNSNQSIVYKKETLKHLICAIYIYIYILRIIYHTIICGSQHH